MPSMDETLNRVKGIIFGLAAGDKIGGPLRMALQIAESLIDCNGFNVEAVGRRYLAWWRREGSVTDFLRF
jgi:ADP-ribosylglycohydrolase